MAKVTFITKDNQEIIAAGESGSLMELAKSYDVKGILGDCGGVGSCGTCHVHIAADDYSKPGELTELEKDMLEFEENVTDYSRLSCQIEVSDVIDGITVSVVN